MGQNNSRALPAPEQLPSDDNEAVPGASVDLEQVRDATRSRRSSMRKSFLSLVKPSSIRSRVNSAASTPGDLRRSWRNSRRWSKAPVAIDSAVPSEDPLPPSSSASSAGPSTADKGKQRENNLSADEEVDEYFDVSEGQPLHSNSPSPQPATAFHHPPPPSDVSRSETKPESQFIVDTDVEQSPVTIPIVSQEVMPEPPHEPHPPDSVPDQPTSPTEPPSAPRPHTIPLPPRQFPPPGTLVVVQGIVHTTDVSRVNPPQPEPSPIPSRPASYLDVGGEPSRSQGRGRLSALLRPRPTSSRPSSVALTEPPPTVTVTPPPEMESPLLTSSESHTSEETAQTGFTIPIVDDTTAPQPLPTTERHPPPPESRLPSISSSSIDVLGTLLSVAAAATAASLLTGSSEPILSSGLAPPASPSSPSTASIPNFPQPVPDHSAAGRAERMRQAWGTIRDHLGLRPSSPTPNPFPLATAAADENPEGANNAAAGDDNPLPTDTRELMLAEMARAFNIGLGLNGLGGISSPTAAGAEGDPEAVGRDANPDSASEGRGDAPPPPPEGSFERFLVDLQIDLRAALTQVEEPVDEAPPSSQQPHTNDPSEVSLDSRPLQHDENTLLASFTENPTPAIGVGPQRQHEDVMEADDVDLDRHSLPQLQEPMDSDSEFDDADDDEDFHSADHESTHGHGASHQHDQGQADRQNRPPMSGTGRIDASGQINWWRLYRFPPIVSPRSEMATGLRQAFAQGVANATGTTTQADISTAGGPTLETPSPTTEPTSTTPPDHAGAPDLPRPSMQPNADSNTPTNPAPVLTSTSPVAQLPPLPLHAIVPVIVVGLQSVNSEWRPDMPDQGDDEGIDFFGQPNDTNGDGPGSEIDGEDDTERWGGEGMRGRGRARGWQSRAANAIRNLRPGRRNAGVGVGANDAHVAPTAPGSRTFLIYVIGGYYPPDHSIVTGGSNNLDSFEALLELADLLGQVKPLTVSKEEIEKSGLETIKASQMVQHEKDGKVASNCMDRCLICLDEYQPDENVRVMACRHAFHQACVDEWLQKGRNNCPACRSTGVPADSSDTSRPAA